MALANGLGICRGRSTLGMVRRVTSQNVGLGQARAAPVGVVSGARLDMRTLEACAPAALVRLLLFSRSPFLSTLFFA